MFRQKKVHWSTNPGSTVFQIYINSMQNVCHFPLIFNSDNIISNEDSSNMYWLKTRIIGYSLTAYFHIPVSQFLRTFEVLVKSLVSHCFLLPPSDSWALHFLSSIVRLWLDYPKPHPLDSCHFGSCWLVMWSYPGVPFLSCEIVSMRLADCPFPHLHLELLPHFLDHLQHVGGLL